MTPTTAYSTTIALFVTLICIASVQGQPPKEVADLYQDSISILVSDEFDDPGMDTTKWTYRKKNLNEKKRVDSNTETVTFSGEYVSLKGDPSEQVGSGIGGLNPCQHGFYEVRWRTRGIDSAIPNPWHPSIWGFRNNSGEEFKAIPKTTTNIEIDLVEYYGTPVLNSHVLIQPKGEKQLSFRFIHLSKDIDEEWHVYGLEYLPSKMAVWTKSGERWEQIKEFAFDAGPNNLEASKISRDHNQPLYWIFSNIWSGAAAKKLDDLDSVPPSYLDIDYFRHYEAKK